MQQEGYSGSYGLLILGIQYLPIACYGPCNDEQADQRVASLIAIQQAVRIVVREYNRFRGKLIIIHAADESICGIMNTRNEYSKKHAGHAHYELETFNRLKETSQKKFDNKLIIGHVYQTSSTWTDVATNLAKKGMRSRSDWDVAAFYPIGQQSLQALRNNVPLRGND